MSNIKGLTDLPSFEPFENINQPGDEKSIKSAEEADHKASTYGHRGILLTDKKNELFDHIKTQVLSFFRKEIDEQQKEFSHTVTKSEEKQYVRRLISFFSRTSLIQDKEKLEIPAKAPLHRDEFKNKIKNMSDLHTEIMLLSDEILSAQDEEVAENKEQLIAKMETLKNELRISERFKPAQAEVRLLENQLQEMEVRLGLRHAQDPVKETEKLFNRSSKDREIKRISKETDIKLEKVFEKPLTLEAITQQAIEILYMDDKEIFDKKEELFLKMEACEKHLEQEKSNPNRISSDIQATTMNLQNARERIDHAIKMYSSS